MTKQALPSPVNKGDRSRQSIVAAARERFALRGYEATTLAEVAAAAGVTGPTVAFHFGSKAGLLRATIEDHIETLLARLQEALSPYPTGWDRLRAFARCWLHADRMRFDLYSVVIGLGGWLNTDNETRLAMHEQARRVSRVLEQLLDEMKGAGLLRHEVPTRLLRDMFFGTAEHLLRGSWQAGRGIDSERMAEQLLDLLRHGAGVSASAAPAALAERGPDALALIEQRLSRLEAQAQDRRHRGAADPTPKALQEKTRR